MPTTRRDTSTLTKWRSYSTSFLPLHYNLLTRIITKRHNIIQSTYHKSHYSTIEQIQNFRVLTENCNEYDVPLHLAFIDYHKTSNSIEPKGLYKVQDNARLYSWYRNLLKLQSRNFIWKMSRDKIIRVQQILEFLIKPNLIFSRTRKFCNDPDWQVK